MIFFNSKKWFFLFFMIFKWVGDMAACDWPPHFPLSLPIFLALLHALVCTHKGESFSLLFHSFLPLSLLSCSSLPHNLPLHPLFYLCLLLSLSLDGTSNTCRPSSTCPQPSFFLSFYFPIPFSALSCACVHACVRGRIVSPPLCLLPLLCRLHYSHHPPHFLSLWFPLLFLSSSFLLLLPPNPF